MIKFVSVWIMIRPKGLESIKLTVVYSRAFINPPPPQQKRNLYFLHHSHQNSMLCSIKLFELSYVSICRWVGRWIPSRCVLCCMALLIGHSVNSLEVCFCSYKADHSVGGTVQIFFYVLYYDTDSICSPNPQNILFYYYYYYYYYYLLQLSFHSMAVVCTLVTYMNKYT